MTRVRRVLVLGWSAALFAACASTPSVEPCAFEASDPPTTERPPDGSLPPVPEGYVGPEFLNREVAQRAIEEEYPEILRKGGIGGVVVVRMRVETSGRVGETRIVRSSGYRALDRAAVRVAEVFRFRPALHPSGCSLPTWAQFPITFRVLD